MRHGDHELTFISTVTTFGTAVDITVSELSIESFFPAEAATAELLRAARRGHRHRRGRRGLNAQPPATAGRIVSSPPSGTAVCSPSRKRMSSPPR